MLHKIITSLFILFVLNIQANENIQEYKSNSYCKIKGDSLFINKEGDTFSYGYNNCYSKEKKFQDLKVSVEFKSVSGSSDQGGGIAWRIQDKSNYYVARFNPLEDNFRLYYVKNGHRIQLKSASIKLNDTYNKMTITNTYNTINAYLNGKLLLTYHDNTFLDEGYVGVWSKADASTLFKYIVIDKI